MGKANFVRFFKIYGDDGDLLPQVKKFVRDKALKSMEQECSMEINKDSENETPYKIFYYKYMHKTPWNEYHIPKGENQEIEKIPDDQLKVNCQMKIMNDSKKNSGLNSAKKDNKEMNILSGTVNSPNNLSNIVNGRIFNTFSVDFFGEPGDDNEDLLDIPEHGTIGSSECMKNKYDDYREKEMYKVKNIDKGFIEAIRKMGILEHSFDKNFVPKLKINNSDMEYNSEISSQNQKYEEYNRSTKIPFKV